MKHSEHIKQLHLINRATEEQAQHQQDLERIKFEINSAGSYHFIKLRTVSSSITLCKFEKRLYSAEEVEEIAKRMHGGLGYFADQIYLDLKKRIEAVEDKFELNISEDFDAER